MLRDIDGNEQHLYGIRPYWQEFRQLEADPTRQEELRLLRLSITEYIDNNPANAVSNYWAGNMLSTETTTLTAGMLGCLFWNTVVRDSRGFTFIRQQSPTADGFPLTVYWIDSAR